jgi:hypothetical protein
MPISVTEAEAGLIAAPWAAAAQNDPGLEQAAKNFAALVGSASQQGKPNPDDWAIMDDLEALLAVELAAQPASSRAASLSIYVKMPQDHDGDTITVYADGRATVGRDRRGPDGTDSLPGADAVMAQYAAIIGHTPSQDELAGFLAARIAGGPLPSAGAAGGTAPVLTATGAQGQVLATGTAAQLLGQWAQIVALNGEATPSLTMPNTESSGSPTPLNATQQSGFLLGLALQQGSAGAAMVQGYNQTVSYFNQIDQPMLSAAAYWQNRAQADIAAGHSDRVIADDTAAQLLGQWAQIVALIEIEVAGTLHGSPPRADAMTTPSSTTTPIAGALRATRAPLAVAGINTVSLTGLADGSFSAQGQILPSQQATWHDVDRWFDATCSGRGSLVDHHHALIRTTMLQNYPTVTVPVLLLDGHIRFGQAKKFL